MSGVTPAICEAMILIEVRHLVPTPDFDHAILHHGHGIEGFECSMGEIGECCTSLRAPSPQLAKRRSHIAVVARHVGRCLLGGVLIGGENFLRAALLGLALIPFDGDEIAGP